ncbi:MAG: hypothetical protein ACTHME_02675 [Candidatus Nitrosocosmicus sp.]
MKEDNNSKIPVDNDKLINNYDTILKESAILTTFSGILFGFLLQFPLS